MRSTEHQRRSPECIFFAPAVAAPKAKGGKSKRISKASSRLSTQSNQTMLSEASSANWEVFGNDSIVTIENEIAPSSQSSMATKKGGRAKRASRLSKNISQIEFDDVAPPSILMEPEDDDFEVKTAPSAAKKPRGRKRKSDEIDNNTSVIQPEPSLVEDLEPPRKRKSTRLRSSVLHAPTSPVATVTVEDREVHMEDADVMHPPPLPKSRKGAKGRTKRASSRTRQVSTASTASVASLRVAEPDDSALDAALEADLNRPLSEDEFEAAAEEAPKSRKRRLTQNKPIPELKTASIAPVRNIVGSNIIEGSLVNGELMQNKTVKAPMAKPKRRVVSRQKVPASQTEAIEPMIAETSESREKPTSKKGDPKGKKAPRKEPAVKRQDQEPSKLEVGEEQQLESESSVVEDHPMQNDSGHETGANEAQSQSKRAAPKRGRALKKIKASQDLEEATTEHAEDERQELETAQLEQVIDEPAVDEIETQNEQSQQVSKKSSKTSHKAKKGAKDKAKPVKAAPPPILPSSSPLQAIEASRHEEVEIQEGPPSPAAVHATPTKPVHAQSVTSPPSDVENRPPSSRPASVRPPLQTLSPSKFQPVRVPLAFSTPMASPSKYNISKLQTSVPWTAVDLDTFFLGATSPEKENAAFKVPKANGELTSPEKKMTVEEWIKKNAGAMEERLRGDCERLVGRFEGEGMRALRTLEGVVCRN